MAEVLHILNGDSSRYLLENSGLKGDQLVWREMLCEGPLAEDMGSDQFWKARYQYYQDTLQVDKLEYYDKVIKELVRIEDLSVYNEVVLWFEYDLFCQVNLLACCSYLLTYYKKDISYYLICVGKEKGHQGWMSLGHFTPQDFPALYTDKFKLSRNDLLYADRCWTLFSSGSLADISTFDFTQNKKFKYLKSAMDQYLENSKQVAGVSNLQRQILRKIKEGSHTKSGLLKSLLNWQQTETVNGFGDLQYQRYLEELDTYYSVENDIYTLNQKGLEALR